MANKLITTLHGNTKDRTGEKYGRLKVLRPVRMRNSKLGWLCECDCGVEAVVDGGNLNSGHTVSCGCAHREMLSASRSIHRMRNSREYKSWCGMKARCLNPRNNRFSAYAGRGIKVCDAWLGSFEAFFADMGPMPGPGYSIDRINNDGNYEPNNCRWGSSVDQANNRRSTVLVVFDGEILTIAEVAKRAGKSDSSVRRLVAKGVILKAAPREMRTLKKDQGPLYPG